MGSPPSVTQLTRWTNVLRNPRSTSAQRDQTLRAICESRDPAALELLFKAINRKRASKKAMTTYDEADMHLQAHVGDLLDIMLAYLAREPTTYAGSTVAAILGDRLLSYRQSMGWNDERIVPALLRAIEACLAVGTGRMYGAICGLRYQVRFFGPLPQATPLMWRVLELARRESMTFADGLSIREATEILYRNEGMSILPKMIELAHGLPPGHALVTMLQELLMHFPLGRDPFLSWERPNGRLPDGHPRRFLTLKELLKEQTDRSPDTQESQ